MVLFALAGSAVAQTGGQVRSTFVPRDAAPAVKPATIGPVVQAQGALQPPIAPAPVANPPKAPVGTESVYVRLDPPGLERLFGTRETERQLEERMRQEAKDAGLVDAVKFPATALLDDPYKPRQFAPSVAIAEPSYVVYRRLYFEEKNAERNGWNKGIIQPLVSTLYFYKDVIFLPHNCASDFCRRFETNAGECWPGNSLPYMLYPPEFTVTGSAMEAAVIIAAIAIVP